MILDDLVQPPQTPSRDRIVPSIPLPSIPRTPRRDEQLARGKLQAADVGEDEKLPRLLQMWMTRLEAQINDWHLRHQHWLQSELPFHLSSHAMHHSYSYDSPPVSARNEESSPLRSISPERNIDPRRLGARAGDEKTSPRSMDSQRSRRKIEDEKMTSPGRPVLPQKLVDLNKSISARKHAFVEVAQNGACQDILILFASLDKIVVLAIIMNAILLGVQIQLNTQGAYIDENGMFFIFVEMAFAIVFVVELVLRVAMQQRRFCCFAWNVYDAILVILQLVDFIAILVSSDDPEARKKLFWRVLVFFRLARTIRLLRFSLRLRSMVWMILMSFWSGVWLWVLALIFIYIVSIALTSGVLDYLRLGDNSFEDFQTLQAHFGDIPTTVYTLFASITHGDTWTLCSDALWRSKPHLAVIFFMYIFVMVFAILNIFLGIVVDRVVHQSRVDRESWTLVQKLEMEDICLKIWQALQSSCQEDISAPDAGDVSLDELLRAVEAVGIKLPTFWEALQINRSDVCKLLQLFGKSSDGEIKAKDFVDTCLRLRGGTRNQDLQMMLLEMEIEQKQWHRQTSLDMRRAFASLSRQFQKNAFRKALSSPRPLADYESVPAFGEMGSYISPFSPRAAAWANSPEYVPEDAHQLPWIRSVFQQITTPRTTTSLTPRRTPRSARST